MRRIRITTWNTGGGFDPPDAATGWSRGTRRVEALRRAVDRLQAEVIALQEIESDRALDELNASLERPYPFVRFARGNSYLDLHQGFLSRFEVECTSFRDTTLTAADGSPLVDYASPEDAERQKPTPVRFQRDVVLADVRVPGNGVISIFNVHLKSQRTSPWRLLDDATVREAESRALVDIVRRHGSDVDPEHPVIVVGDLNAKPDDESIRPILDGLRFYDVLEREWIALSRAPDHTHRGRQRARIDYVLLSPAARRRYRPDSVRVHASVDTRAASDHFPVSIDLR